MRAVGIASLLFASALAAVAQNGTVLNAALYQGALYPGFSGIPYILNGSFAASFLEVSFLGPLPPNIISPRTLAVLSYSAPIPFLSVYDPQPRPVNATLYIRPVGSTTLIPVNISSAATGAVTFVVPGYAPIGSAELLYQIDNGATQWTPINIVPSSFAFFRNGISGPALAQAIPSSGPGFTVGLATPIKPSQTLMLTGSGLGYGTNVTATIGGVSAPVIYAGPSGTAPAGNDQILLQVPPGMADSCYVTVALTVNQARLTTTISETSDGSPCKHPWQLSLNDMKTLDSGGSLVDAPLDLQTALGVVTPAAGSRNESALLSLSYISAAPLAGYFQPLPAAAGCNALTPNSGAFLSARLVLANLGGPPAPRPAPLPDIGSSITLQSPTTKIEFVSPGMALFNSQGVPPPIDGPLSNLPAPAISGGKWTFQSPGGADLPASSFGFTLPAPAQLTGGVPVMMNHTQDQTVSWNGAAFDAGATALVSLQGSGLISCTAPASAGTLTIPAALLSGFPPNTIGRLTISIDEAGAYLPHAEFQMKNGATLLLFVPFSSSDTRPVFFQ